MPLVGHHQHLLSPAIAEMIAPEEPAAIELPADVSRLLRAREAAWNDSVALAPLYAEDVTLFDGRESRWIFGRAQAVPFLAELFAGPYVITPLSYTVHGATAHVAGYFTRVAGAETRHFGHVLLGLRRGDDGAWRIAAETHAFPGPTPTRPYTADQLVAHMDEAGVRRAVILSLGYAFGSVHQPPVADEYARVRAENDWTAREAARFPDRLVAFCGVNPLKAYALAEVDRCAREVGMRGLKLHFGNSGVDVLDPAHVEKVRAVFRAANERRMPIVAHLWTVEPAYGGPHSEVFLARILPEAPDVVVQVAHLAGAGPGYGPDAALEPLAEAVAAGDPRTRNLYFDVTTNVTTATSAEDAALVARRIRQIGVDRILFGSDGAWGGNPTPRQAWAAFRGFLPLTDAEFRTIAGNVAPYLR